MNRTNRLVLYSPFTPKSIISYGLIVFSKNTGRWLLVRRKHSVEFLTFIKGFYRLTYLPILLSLLTHEETLMIRDLINEKSFNDLYFSTLKLDSNNYRYALDRFLESKDIIMSIINIVHSDNSLQWNWPRGRVSDNRENPFLCACREFVEEVEVPLPQPMYISKNYYSEIINTVTGRCIESRYWIYVIENEIYLNPVENHDEVSHRAWFTTEQCNNLLYFPNLLTTAISVITKYILNSKCTQL